MAAPGTGLVVVVGGSGYLGMHLLQHLAAATTFQLAYTFNTHPPSAYLQGVLGRAHAFHVDVLTGAGFDAISQILGTPSVVINCAAMSNPTECEDNPEMAYAVNVPRFLLHWMSSFGYYKPLLIHLSTDQVYEGTQRFYTEEDEANPVNVYGKTKLEAEQYIKTTWPNYVTLRSSIIYGPHPIVQVDRSLPVQWIDSVLASGMETDFYVDQYRCPIFVKDVVRVIELLIVTILQGGSHVQLLLNMGGTERMSRAGMAETVARVRGRNISLINRASFSSQRTGMRSPADISMDITKLQSLLGVTLTKFADGVQQTFDYAVGPLR